MYKYRYIFMKKNLTCHAISSLSYIEDSSLLQNTHYTSFIPLTIPFSRKVLSFCCWLFHHRCYILLLSKLTERKLAVRFFKSKSSMYRLGWFRAWCVFYISIATLFIYFFFTIKHLVQVINFLFFFLTSVVLTYFAVDYFIF
jgi:hypothetical protein